MGEIRWARINSEPFEYAIQPGPHGDELVKLLDGSRLRRPEGYILVPKEPTAEMIEAGDAAMDWDSSDLNGSYYVHYHDGDAKKSWKAMLAAFSDPKREDGGVE